jgi:hypothetical protein
MNRSVARYLGIGRGGGQQIIGLGLSVVVGDYRYAGCCQRPKHSKE